MRVNNAPTNVDASSDYTKGKKYLSLTMALLLFLQTPICIICSVFGGGIANSAFVKAFVNLVGLLIPAVHRVGALANVPQIGSFTLAVGSVMSVWAIAIVLWLTAFSPNLTKEKWIENRKRLAETDTRFADTTMNFWLTVLGYLLFLCSVLADFGMFDALGFASGSGIYNVQTDWFFSHGFHSSGMKYGAMCSLLTLCLFIVYASVLSPPIFMFRFYLLPWISKQF